MRRIVSKVFLGLGAGGVVGIALASAQDSRDVVNWVPFVLLVVGGLLWQRSKQVD